MAWDHLAINQPHLVYIILGGFTSLFMLCSSFIKERLYIGEATVATICGIIFGPRVANLINPNEWGNTDQLTMEFSRIVLVVQCFAVGVELPKYYMEKHWRSVTFLLIPVMTFGWLITSLFIWWMIPTLNWLESLCISACVTATDPVLASSVVGKGKFARRVPKHLRDVLSAESGINDGMAFPFVYLALYLLEHRPDAKKVAFSWFLITILYECVFGAIYGFVIGYIGRHGIKLAEEHDLVDRESFLVFYFVLALFCAGSGSILGVDDLLVGFCAGVGFSNDGWFTQKTEESHVSNVIDLLLNLAYFVYLGTIIPWENYDNAEFGISPWRLIVIAIFVILFRRIPAMLLFKPFIPDIKTWREALFAGHFGPIGVGGIFVAILARAELSTGGPTPPFKLDPDGPHYVLAWLIWPITSFLVISSILVHGSSIAVFTLGKHINTLALTMSYTAANEDGPVWLNRLPKITSTSRSQAKSMTSETDEKDARLDRFPPGMLPPIGIPKEFLRRQKEEDTNTTHLNYNHGSTKIRRERKKKMKWEDGVGPGGPISQSAIFPQRSEREVHEGPVSDTVTHDKESLKNKKNSLDVIETFDQSYEATNLNQHNMLDQNNFSNRPHSHDESGELESQNEIEEMEELHEDRKTDSIVPINSDEKSRDYIHYDASVNNNLKINPELGRQNNDDNLDNPADLKSSSTHRKREMAQAYHYGNTIIVENKDGEVLKTFEFPSGKPKQSVGEQNAVLQGVSKVGQWTGIMPASSEAKSESSIRQGINRWASRKNKLDERSEKELVDEKDDRLIRFKIDGKGTRLTKEELIQELQSMDPKTRFNVITENR